MRNTPVLGMMSQHGQGFLFFNMLEIYLSQKQATIL